MEAILDELLWAVALAIAGIITRFVILLIKKAANYINAKIDKIKDDDFRQHCKDMMQAAETMTTELLNGPEKKEWVIKELMKYAKEKDIPITEEKCGILVQTIFQELNGITLNTNKKEKIDSIITESIDKTLKN